MSDEQPEDTVARMYGYVADNLADLYVIAAASAVLGALVQSQLGYVGVIIMVVVGALVSLAMSWFLYRKAERMNEVPSELTVAVHMEGGSYWAEVVELPGCFAAGDTFGELQESLQEAIELYLDGTPMESEVFHVEPMEEIWTPKPIHEPKAINE